MELATSIILAMTLIAIIWYSIETHLLRKVTGEQIELENRPLVQGEIKLERTGNLIYPKLSLENIGNGLAINVKVDNIEIKPKNIEDIFMFSSNQIIHSISKNEKKELSLQCFKNRTRINQALIESDFNIGYFKSDYRIAIKYSNINFKTYITEVCFDENGFKEIKTFK